MRRRRICPILARPEFGDKAAGGAVPWPLGQAESSQTL